MMRDADAASLIIAFCFSIYVATASVNAKWQAQHVRDVLQRAAGHPRSPSTPQRSAADAMIESELVAVWRIGYFVALALLVAACVGTVRRSVYRER